MDPTQPGFGMIIARTCPTCGHHEIGYIDQANAFHPLKPGDQVQVWERESLFPDLGLLPESEVPSPVPISHEHLTDWVAWAPEPVKSDKTLRIKYGVMVDRDLLTPGMPAGLYRIAFRQKLRRLISEEKYTPLAVILDRFFSAPNLATGTPLHISEALMAELDELRLPVERVQAWLDHPNDETLQQLIYPKNISDLDTEPISDEAFLKELGTVSIEEFFNTLDNG